MKCEEVQAERIAERYVRGGLTAGERTAFEEHFATCTDCFEHMRTLEINFDLTGRAAPRRKKRRKKHRARKYGWVWLLAAALAGAAGLTELLQLRPPLPSEPATASPQAAPPRPAAPRGKAEPDAAVIANLAAVEPPVYVESKRQAKDSPSNKDFLAAMDWYSVKDYAQAAKGLRKASELDRKASGPRFYLAICELMLNQTDNAEADLRAVIDLGDPLYLEEAHFFLAKTLLGTHDLRGARDELFRAIRLAGDRLVEARQVLDQLDVQLQGKPRK